MDIKRKKKEKRIRLLGGLIGIISIILVLLQKARKAEAVAKLAAGMNGHIAKPIQVDKLLSTLKTILTENIIL